MAEKGVLSARGERVDFDLMKIKQQIAAAPKAVTVKAREDFIDQKSKRRLNRQIREVVAKVSEEATIIKSDELPLADTTSSEETE
jgi:hypothetical protein